MSAIWANPDDIYSLSALPSLTRSGPPQFPLAALAHRSLKYGGKRPDNVCGCSGGSPLGAIATELETCDGIGLVAPSGVQIQNVK
jgi:hypothetical protein